MPGGREAVLMYKQGRLQSGVRARVRCRMYIRARFQSGGRGRRAQMYIVVTFHRAGGGRGTMYKETRFQREVGVIKCIGSVDVSEVRAQMLGRARGSSTVGVGVRP